jgi:Caulimovirus viroplasmin
MPKSKFYAVARGRQTGIFSTWPECQTQVRHEKRKRKSSMLLFHKNDAFSSCPSPPLLLLLVLLHIYHIVDYHMLLYCICTYILLLLCCLYQNRSMALRMHVSNHLRPVSRQRRLSAREQVVRVITLPAALLKVQVLVITRLKLVVASGVLLLLPLLWTTRKKRHQGTVNKLLLRELVQTRNQRQRRLERLQLVVIVV